MIERLDIALKRARENYKELYKFELDNKDDSDLSDEQWDCVSDKRNEIRQLYWIKNEEVKVKFDKDIIKVKYPNREEIIY